MNAGDGLQDALWLARRLPAKHLSSTGGNENG
jgi:hypothetical protein